MKRKKTKKLTAKDVDYKLTEQERVAIQKYVERRANTSPRLKVSSKDGVPTVKPDHPDEAVGLILLMQALGNVDPNFFDGILNQLTNAGSRGKEISEHGLNFMLSVIKGIEPRDQLEVMLAAQIAAVHMATMTFARRLAHVDNIAQQDSAERAFNKLARTFVSQMEGLKRYRTGGEQKVTVQHVSVSEGGQAIVGNVTQTASEKSPNTAAATPPALSDGRTAAMPIIEENKETAVIPARRGRDK